MSVDMDNKERIALIKKICDHQGALSKELKKNLKEFIPWMDHTEQTIDDLMKQIDDILLTHDKVVKENEQLKREYFSLITKESNQNKKQHKTYAEVTSTKNDAINNNITQEHTIIFRSRDKIDPKDIPSKVFNAIDIMRKDKNGSKKNIKINKVIRSKTGAILKIPNEENVDALIAYFKGLDSLNKCAEIYPPKMHDPVIVLKNINKIHYIKDIPKNLCDINQQLEGLDKEFTVLFAGKSHTDTHNVFMRVSPKVFQIFTKSNRLYLNYEAIKWQRNIYVKQCQNCFEFHPKHQSKTCTNEKICKTCGDRKSVV